MESLSSNNIDWLRMALPSARTPDPRHHHPFFKQQLFSFQIVHQTRILFVNHRQFTFGHGQIKASDTTLDVANQQNWKWVVHEHFVNRTIFQANQHPFAAIGASNDFYVSNDRFYDPLSLLLARKGEQLQLLFLA